MNTLGKQLSLYRESKGLSQSQLSVLSNVPQSAISEIESGKRRNPGILHMRQLACALNINLLELMPSDELVQPFMTRSH